MGNPQRDIEAAKEQFDRGELRLDGYLQRLIAAQTVQRPGTVEQDQVTYPGPTDSSHAANPAVAAKEPMTAQPPPEPVPPLESAAPRVEILPTVIPLRTNPAAASRADRRGQVLGDRFELQEEVGTGGIAIVYRALDRLAGRRPVAVKLLRPEIQTDIELCTAVLNVAAALRELRHPQIEQILELHQSGGERAIIAAWLEGQSLAQRLDQGPALRTAEVRDVIAAMTHALDFAHRNGFVHGDLKPGNILMDVEGGIHLLDFGFYLPPKSEGPTLSSAMPRGVTGRYASVEVMSGSRPTPRDDIYSAACVIYRLLTGEWAYGTRTGIEAMVENATPQRPRGITTRQWDALKRGLAFRRMDRPMSIGELTAPFLAPERHWGRRVGWTAVVLVVLGAIAAGWYLFDSGKLPIPVAVPLPAGNETERPVTSRVAPAVASDPAPAPAPNVESTGIAAQAPLPPPVADELPAPEPAAELAAVPPPSVTPPPVELPAQEPPVVQPPPPPSITGPPPFVGFADSQLVFAEADGIAKLPVRLSRAYGKPVRLFVRAESGDARINEDFMSPPISLVIPSGQTRGTVLVPLVGDDLKEHVEDFTVTLELDGEGGQLRNERMTVVLLDGG